MNLINWVLQLAGKWPYWSKHPLVDLFVSGTLSIYLMQMEYLERVLVLTPHCNTTWEKSLSPICIKTHTKALLHHRGFAGPHLAWPLALPGLSQLGPAQHRCAQGGRWAADCQCGSMAPDSGSPQSQSPLFLQENSNSQLPTHNSKSACARAETLG